MNKSNTCSRCGEFKEAWQDHCPICHTELKADVPTVEEILKELIVVNKELTALNIMLDQSDTLSYFEESKMFRITEKLSDVIRKMEKIVKKSGIHDQDFDPGNNT